MALRERKHRLEPGRRSARRCVGVAVPTLASLVATACGTLGQLPSTCLRKPASYDWQLLDDTRVLVWTLPDAVPYDLTLGSSLPELRNARDLELIDGNRDGLVCGDGWDSAGAVQTEEGYVSDSVPVLYVSRANDASVAELKTKYAETLEPRRPSTGS